MNKSYWGSFLVLLSALGFGVMPIFALFAYRDGMNTITLLTFRFLISAVFLFIYIFLKGIKIHITKTYLISVFILGGVFYTFMSFGYFTGIKYISPSLGVLLLYTYPFFVSILSFIFEGQKPSFRNMLSMVVSILGLVLVLYQGMAASSTFGITIILFAALVYSCYIIYGNRVVRQHSSIITSAFVAMFSALGLGSYGIITGSIGLKFTPTIWISILGLSFFSTIMAILAFFKGLEIVGSTRAAIISMVEPIFTILLTTIFFSQGLTPLQWVGAIAVLGGSMYAAIEKEAVEEEVPQQEPVGELVNSE